jgi:hypothetical protein
LTVPPVSFTTINCNNGIGNTTMPSSIKLIIASGVFNCDYVRN